MTLDPEILRIQSEDGALWPGLRSILRRPRPEERRRQAAEADARRARRLGLAVPPVDVESVTVPVDGWPDVTVRIHRPPGTSSALPGNITFFGGAFRQGSNDYETNRWMHAQRALDAEVAVIAVDYALAPEHRYPTQIEQVHAAWEWLHDEATSLGIDAGRVGISGSSAGGNLAAALTLMNRDRARRPVAVQILEVPVTDLTGRWIDLRATYALGVPAFIALRELVSVARTYLGDRSRAAESYASPMRADSLADLPPAVVLTAEYDPLRSDGAAYAARLRRSGVEASATRYLGVTHDTPIYVGALPAARRWEAEVVAALRRI